MGQHVRLQPFPHWGALSAIVEDDRVVGAAPFARDPDSSPLIDAIPDAGDSPTRIAGPMVRSGWLERGPGSGSGRGREPFVPVGWQRALDLVAGELARVWRAYTLVSSDDMSGHAYAKTLAAVRSP
jgi:biotin/methionine sulfoxide reductase